MSPEPRCLEAIRNPGLLNQFLNGLRDKGGGHGKSISIETLRKDLAYSTFEGAPLPFPDLLDLLLLLAFVQRSATHVSATPAGQTFLNANPNGEFELTIEQRRLLVLHILHSRRPLYDQFVNVLPDFTFNRTTRQFESQRQASSGRLPNLGIRLFCSGIGFIRPIPGGGKSLDPTFNEQIMRRVRILRNPQWSKADPTEEDFDASKQAEYLVRDDEVARLGGIGRQDLAERVFVIADFDSAAGYDIESYEDATSRVEIPDRFIEVKSSKSEQVRFFFTGHEDRMAREYREKYRIVFVGNHAPQKPLGQCKLHVIVDPHPKIRDVNIYMMEAPKWVVRLVEPAPGVRQTPP